MNTSQLLITILGALVNVAVVLGLAYYVVRANHYPRLGRWGRVLFLLPVFVLLLSLGIKWIWADFTPARFWFETAMRFMMLGMFLIMVGLMLTFVDNAIAFMQYFHQQHNAKNLDRIPVRWLFQYPERIRRIYQYGFALGSIPILYGIFFAMKF